MPITIIIDRIKIPAYDTVTINDLEERELVFEQSTNSLVLRVNNQLLKIPYEPVLIEVLTQKLIEYFETNSVLIPTKRPENPKEGSIYFDPDSRTLRIYVNGKWYTVHPHD